MIKYYAVELVLVLLITLIILVCTMDYRMALASFFISVVLFLCISYTYHMSVFTGQRNRPWVRYIIKNKNFDITVMEVKK